MGEEEASCKEGEDGPEADYDPKEIGMRAFLGTIEREKLKKPGGGIDILKVRGIHINVSIFQIVQ